MLQEESEANLAGWYSKWPCVFSWPPHVVCLVQVVVTDALRSALYFCFVLSARSLSPLIYLKAETTVWFLLEVDRKTMLDCPCTACPIMLITTVPFQQ